MKSKLLGKIKSVIKNVEPSARVILFGSRARKDHRRVSDWDLLILLNGQVDTMRIDRVRHSLYEVEWETGQIISSIVRSARQWNAPQYRSLPLHANVEKDGILL
jgi:predicted nucleotidyltransferase